MSDALLAVDDLHTYLGDSHIIQGVSLAVPAGKVVALLGRNGAGKTTTLALDHAHGAPRRGRVTFDGATSARSRPSRSRAPASRSCRRRARSFPRCRSRKICRDRRSDPVRRDG